LSNPETCTPRPTRLSPEILRLCLFYSFREKKNAKMHRQSSRQFLPPPVLPYNAQFLGGNGVPEHLALTTSPWASRPINILPKAVLGILQRGEMAEHLDVFPLFSCGFVTVASSKSNGEVCSLIASIALLRFS
jgi:hypothetical protein